MRNTILVIFLATLLSGCLGLPTIETTPTKVVDVIPRPPKLTPTAMIQITGTVYVRDADGNIKGWLYKGDQLQAACASDWCQILGDNYRDYYFWRGCSSDNPERKNCQARGQ